MVFLGDIACPDNKIDDFIKCVNSIADFANDTIIFNFEGTIVDEAHNRRAPTLYNVTKITEAFAQSKKVIVSFANNHMYDYPDHILETKKILEKAGIGTFGLMEDQQIKPYEYDDGEHRYAFFGHCWRLYTHTNPNRINEVRVVDCRYGEFINQVANYIKTHPEVRVVCFMHWNYDREVLPFPMLRDISYSLIDAGVYSIIGNHSHRPQGIEIYKNKLIAYCLGNFYIPSGIYFNGTLNYPDECKRTYAVLYRENAINFIWFNTDCSIGNVIERVTKEGIDGNNIKSYSAFASHLGRDYVSYFSRARANKFLVPVFGKYKPQVAIDFQEFLAIQRIHIIKYVHRITKGEKA